MAALKNKKTSRKTNTTIAIEPTARHVWLASLGTLVAVRRESKTVAQRVVTGMKDAAARLRRSARNIETDLRDGVTSMRGQVQPTMMKLSSDVEARLAPIVDKLGLDKFGMAKTKRATRKGRKPAAKKAAVRRTSSKPAKRAAKKIAG